MTIMVNDLWILMHPSDIEDIYILLPHICFQIKIQEQFLSLELSLVKTLPTTANSLTTVKALHPTHTVLDSSVSYYKLAIAKKGYLNTSKFIGWL